MRFYTSSSFQPERLRFGAPTLPYRSLTDYQQLQHTFGLSEWEFTEGIVVLETHFGVILPDESLTPILTVGELCAMISQQVGHSNR